MAQDRYERSEKWLERALLITPLGTQTRSKRFCEGAYPTTLAGGLGSHVWDVDKNEYIDWVLGLGAVGLGHGYVQSIRSGSYSLPHRVEVEYAEALLPALKWPEQVRFVKTGSEATEGAMMMARRATGRQLILSVGYHGWHFIHQPSEILVDVHWGSLEAILAAETAPVAAVIVEPHRTLIPPPRYWTGLRDLCDRMGAMLIVDEMVTGFRWALGGATEYWNIKPDLACYGKAMANGYPLACIVGKREIMEEAEIVSSTFGGEVASLAMARLVLEVYQKEPVIEVLWARGSALQRGFKAERFECVGYPCHPTIRALGGDMERFLVETAVRGVLFHPKPFNVSYSHTELDVERSLEAAWEAGKESTRREIVECTGE